MKTPPDWKKLADDIKTWSRELGFCETGITDIELDTANTRLQAWLEKGFHGEMDYMARHADLRADPKKLVPEVVRAITVRIDYLPPDTKTAEVLRNKDKAYVSRYALGRDYHKLIRKRLQKLADRIQETAGPFNYRAFADSAPVLEKPLAEKSGLGWIGKHTNLINRKAGSWFFLGVLYTDLPLPLDEPVQNHCGRCQACIDVCPTQAIIGPYQLDARRCISYLTIELQGSIPEELRPLIGNRIYGCDDCQLVCPWNRFAKTAKDTAFHARNGLADSTLIEVFAWEEAHFLKVTEGSAIRRIGYLRWLRNVATALGNAPTKPEIIDALKTRENHDDPMVREHVHWALAQHSSANRE